MYTEAGEPKQVHCRLLVGADGYFSTVRQQCLGDGPPDFAVSLGQYSCLYRASSQAVLCKICIAAWGILVIGCRDAEHSGNLVTCTGSTMLGLCAGDRLLESAAEGGQGA